MPDVYDTPSVYRSSKNLFDREDQLGDEPLVPVSKGKDWGGGDEFTGVDRSVTWVRLTAGADVARWGPGRSTGRTPCSPTGDRGSEE